MAEPSVDRGRLALVTMTLANAMILVDQTAVPLALPSVMQQFGVASQAVQWVLSGSLLPLAGLLVLGGRLGNLLGRRRVFLTGALVFSGASAVGGLAPSFGVLLAARVLQGVGGALMLPATVAIVSSAFSRAGRGRALGTICGIAAVAGALYASFPTDLERQSRTQGRKVHLLLAIVTFAAVATAGVLLGGTVQHLADRGRTTRGPFGIARWALLVTVLLIAAALVIRPLRAAFGALTRLFYAAMIAWFPPLGVQLTGLR